MKRALMVVVATFALILLGTDDALAQDHITAQEIGNIIYFSGTIDGQQVSGTTQRIGRFEYTDYSNGLSATTQRIGAFEYTDFSDGTSMTTQSLGGIDYSTIDPGYDSECCEW